MSGCDFHGKPNGGCIHCIGWELAKTRAMLHEAIRLLAVPMADMDTEYGAACDAFLSRCPEASTALATLTERES